MPRGVKVYSSADGSGYGVTAVAYVRGLLHAGVPVHWVPLSHQGSQMQALTAEERAALCQQAAGDLALCDLPELLAATQRPLDGEVVLAYTPPEHWAPLFGAARRKVGFTTWELDRLPSHWPALLRQADVVCVPSRQNMRVFGAELPDLPLHCVPHIRRHAWNPILPSALADFRASLQIPPGHFVFYSINTWDPRKNLPFLLRAFCEAFGPQDPVSLVLKTSPQGYGAPPFYPITDSAALAQDLLADLGATGDLPAICLLPYTLNGQAIDWLHALGDCYVSFSHGEGWGMGAFDAATLGKPVLMTGWGGQQDYLGDTWLGAVPWRLQPPPVWPVQRPSFWPSQRWAAPDFAAAVAALRAAWRAPEPLREEAAEIQQRLCQRFAEPEVMPALLEALFG